MNTVARQKTPPPSPLEHRLTPHFRELARFNSTRALAGSPLYARLRAEVERVLEAVEVGDSAPAQGGGRARRAIRATAWNIERGIRLEGIIRALREDEVLGRSDVLLLTELDYGMARSGNGHVAREILA